MSYFFKVFSNFYRKEVLEQNLLNVFALDKINLYFCEKAQMKQYGRIKYDLFFKKVFTKPHIVIAFLNTVLEKELKSPIATVSFKPNDFIIKGKNILINENKHDVIDIFCIDQEERRILIEIQKGTKTTAIPRFLDYQCRNYSSQFPVGADYKEVVACYSICWFFDLIPAHKSLTETISLCSTEENTDWNFEWKIKALYPHNLDYEALKERMIEKIEEWMLLDVMRDPAVAKNIKAKLKTPEVDEAFEDLDISGYTEEELRLSEYYEFMDEYEDIDRREKEKFAREEALKKQKEIAKKMLEQNMKISLIAEITGLSEKEIKKL